MNNSDPEIELLNLRPLAPSPELEERIAAALAPAVRVVRRPAPRGFWLNFGWAFAGVAAGVALTTAWHAAPAVTAEAKPEGLFEAVASAQEIVEEEAAEIVQEEGQEPAQLVRTSSLQRYTWTNPANGAFVQVELPREDLQLVPLAYQ